MNSVNHFEHCLCCEEKIVTNKWISIYKKHNWTIKFCESCDSLMYRTYGYYRNTWPEIGKREYNILYYDDKA